MEGVRPPLPEPFPLLSNSAVISLRPALADEFVVSRFGEAYDARSSVVQSRGDDDDAQYVLVGSAQSALAPHEEAGVNNFWRDVRFGFRLLRKSPGFTAVAVLALALGIGANTAIYSIVYTTLLEPLPYPNPNQLVMVWSKIQGNRNVVSVGDYLDWKRESDVFQGLGAWSEESLNLGTASRPERVQAAEVTPGFSAMMGEPLFLGRDFLPEEGEVGKDHVAVLTHRFWLDRFGGDRTIIGRTVSMNGAPYTIVGVNRPGVSDRGRDQLSVPLAFKPEQINLHS